MLRPVLDLGHPGKVMLIVLGHLSLSLPVVAFGIGLSRPWDPGKGSWVRFSSYLQPEYL